MKASLIVLLAALSLACSAAASDITSHAANHKTALKTNHTAQCSNPSAKASRQCMQTASIRH